MPRYKSPNAGAGNMFTFVISISVSSWYFHPESELIQTGCSISFAFRLIDLQPVSTKRLPLGRNSQKHNLFSPFKTAVMYCHVRISKCHAAQRWYQLITTFFLNIVSLCQRCLAFYFNFFSASVLSRNRIFKIAIKLFICTKETSAFSFMEHYVLIYNPTVIVI